MSENCGHFREILENMLSRDLPAVETEAVERHLSDCPECRNYHAALLKDDESLNAFAASMQGLGSRIRDAVFRASDPEDQTAHHKARFWSRPAVRVVAAVAVIAAIVVLSSLFDSLPRRDVVWADVAKKIESPPSYIARSRTFHDGRVIGGFTRFNSPELGRRIDFMREKSAILRSIYAVQSKTHTVTQFEEKVCLRDSIGPDTPYDSQKDPHLRKMREFMQRDHESLGLSEIDGTVVSGIEIVYTGPEPWRPGHVMRWRIYADVETQLPVLFESESANDSLTRYGRVEYEWNPQFAPEDFDPPVPGDFFVADLRVPIDTLVGRARNGLRNFADITGRYPENLGFSTLRREVAAELDKLNQAGTYSSEIEDSLNTILHAGVLRHWGDHAPRELWSPPYGDYDSSVVPGDSERILMRWKMFDKAGLLYGDLRYEITDSEPYDEIDRKQWEEYLEKNKTLSEELRKKLGVDSLAGSNAPSL